MTHSPEVEAWLASYDGSLIQPDSMPADMPPDYFEDVTTPKGLVRRIWLTDAGMAAAQAARKAKGTDAP